MLFFTKHILKTKCWSSLHASIHLKISTVRLRSRWSRSCPRKVKSPTPFFDKVQRSQEIIQIIQPAVCSEKSFVHLSLWPSSHMLLPDTPLLRKTKSANSPFQGSVVFPLQIGVLSQTRVRQWDVSFQGKEKHAVILLWKLMTFYCVPRRTWGSLGFICLWTANPRQHTRCKSPVVPNPYALRLRSGCEVTLQNIFPLADCVWQ